MEKITLGSIPVIKNEDYSEFLTSILKVSNDKSLTREEIKKVDIFLSKLNLVTVDKNYQIKFTKFD
jgi:hypothetical protein